MKNIFTKCTGLLSITQKIQYNKKLENFVFPQTCKSFITTKILSMAITILKPNLNITNLTAKIHSVFIIFTMGKKGNAKSHFIQ